MLMVMPKPRGEVYDLDGNEYDDDDGDVDDAYDDGAPI